MYEAEAESSQHSPSDEVPSFTLAPETEAEAGSSSSSNGRAEDGSSVPDAEKAPAVSELESASFVGPAGEELAAAKSNNNNNNNNNDNNNSSNSNNLAPGASWRPSSQNSARRTFSVSTVPPVDGGILGACTPSLPPASPSSPAIAADARRGSPSRPNIHTLTSTDDLFENMERQVRLGSIASVTGRVWNDSRRRMHSSKRSYRRLVFKNGECNISHVNIKKRKRRFLADIFTTLVDIKWRYTLLLFICAFIITWVLFALVWWLIGFAHEDFAPNRPKSWIPCVEHVTGFTTALLFSIETQHTIGYGKRVVTANCPEAVLMVMMQSCLGVIIQVSSLKLRLK